MTQADNSESTVARKRIGPGGRGINPSKKTLTITLGPEVLRELRILAAQNDTTPSQVIRDALTKAYPESLSCLAQ